MSNLVPSNNPENLMQLSQQQGLKVWTDTTGKPYLVEQRSNGEVTLIPLETALTQLQQQSAQPSRQHDPIALIAIAIAMILGIAVAGYFLGFVAGKNGQSTVIVPRSPVCETQRSSFLFWSSERKECQ